MFEELIVTCKMMPMADAVTAKGTPVWLALCEDVGYNQGGYYCQYYLDSECDEMIDDFVIHADKIALTDDAYDAAWRLAIEYVRHVVEY